jgi:ATP-dependent Lon protease
MGIMDTKQSKRSISVSEEEDLNEAVDSFMKGFDLHLNFPAAAIKKDGPSAGITITTCLVSLFTNRKVKPEVAMTGEVSLHGEVLPVGGIKEKCIGAVRNGIKTIILPNGNRDDVEEMGEDVKKSLKFHFVHKVEEVLNLALERNVDQDFLDQIQKPIFKAKI